MMRDYERVQQLYSHSLRQAAAAEHTLKVERLLETIQQRTLDRMKQQQNDM